MDRLVLRAVAFEDRGQRFYEDMAERATSGLARALFENLARDERSHAELIRSLRSELDGEDGGPSVARAVPIEDRIRDAFVRLGQQAGPGGQDIIRGLEVAMSMEEEAITLYREMLDHDPASRERAFLEQILDEEWQHLEALRNVYFYLTRTGEWFDQQESRRWNWMNI